MNGQDMYKLAQRLFPIPRSITGKGVRDSLAIIKEYVPELEIHETPTGTQVFDWTIPQEWEINEAYIEDSKGNRIIDFAEHNLHVLGYSEPIDKYVSLEELLEYVYVDEARPGAIPYVTSYYKKRSGFCMSKNQRDSLKQDTYHMYIDSKLKDGFLTYADVVIPADSEHPKGKEIYFSTYICHPSMANNECSGPCLMVALIDAVKKMKNRKYDYRFYIGPETIGSINYLAHNLKTLQDKMAAGFVLTCEGDNRVYSYIPSREGDTLADRVALNVLKHHSKDYLRFTFLDRASDERQYCAPGVDLPVCCVCRSRCAGYPEYHTSDDDLTVISPEGFDGSLQVYTKIINALEYNENYKVTCFCEPQLGKRGLYPTVSKRGSYDEVAAMRHLIAYADGKRDLLQISEKIGQPIDVLIPVIDRMLSESLFEIV
ncbi:MAG: DUF4910 domain-containing protein [Lachnospiraceae bacterium]|nr:DUF4910 domain-containing protein [Lachnospiraceae bacterium]